jgi:PAS domain S-box-containing protein
VNASRPDSIEELQARLADAEETLRAIHSGDVDALVVHTDQGVQVFTLKGAEEPYRILVERMQEGALTVASDGAIVYANRRFAEMVALPLEQVVGRRLRDFIAAPQHPSLESLLASTSWREEFALGCADGTVLPVLLSVGGLPVEGASALSVIVTDLTQQKHRDELASSERFAKAVVQQATDAMLVCDDTGRIRQASGAAISLIGRSLVGLTLAEAFDDPALCSAGAILDGYARKARAGEVIREVELEIPSPSGPRVYLLSAGPLTTSRQADAGCIMSLIDITRRKQAEQHQQMLMQELSHRVKNVIAVVGSIATQSLSEHRPLREVRAAFLGRLQALSNTQTLLTGGLWQGARLRDLVSSEVAPYGERAQITGADIFLNAKAAQTLGLVLHELATNAAKYGALSVPDGRVSIGWEVVNGGTSRRFRLQWTERGGPTVEPPKQKGFGQRLVEQAVTYDLSGKGRVDFRSEGLHYLLDADADAMIAVT